MRLKINFKLFPFRLNIKLPLYEKKWSGNKTPEFFKKTHFCKCLIIIIN